MVRPTIAIGKSVRRLARLRGGGSALPGLVAEKIDPKFVKRTLDQLPYGIVLVSGTNGKTTTTKMIVELLEGQGLSVFTNPTGSNFTRGVAAALLGEVDLRGKLDADIAVLELDEAYAAKFVKDVSPNYALLLNVMRDQLDRFGEIDHTARLLQVIAENTTKGVVLNREDRRIRAFADLVQPNTKVRFFGLDESLRDYFPSDEDLHGKYDDAAVELTADGELTAFDDSGITFTLDQEQHLVSLRLSGAYNYFNAAAALTMVRLILGSKLDTEKLFTTLEKVTPAFGRGEVIQLGDEAIELVLVKNPSGFRLALSSFNPDEVTTMIAINDRYADGRDMSWLWDVSFESLRDAGVTHISGVRAYDMALRLYYDEVPVGQIIPDLKDCLIDFLASKPGNKRIFCSYTAMLTLRKELSRITKVEEIGA